MKNIKNELIFKELYDCNSVESQLLFLLQFCNNIIEPIVINDVKK